MTISTNFIEAINSEVTDEVFLILLEIDSDELAAPIRVVNDLANITSNGDEYVAFPFKIKLPNKNPETLARLTLEIDNIDREIVKAVRDATSPLSVVFTVILAADPDVKEIELTGLKITNVTYNELVVRGTLEYNDILNARCPVDSHDPANFPGMF